jgi:hypothetical protein
MHHTGGLKVSGNKGKATPIAASSIKRSKASSGQAWMDHAEIDSPAPCTGEEEASTKGMDGKVDPAVPPATRPREMEMETRHLLMTPRLMVLPHSLTYFFCVQYTVCKKNL